jgi:hypothetical protein
MIDSIVGAIWMAPAALILGRFYSAHGIAIGYLLGGTVIGFGFSTFPFMKWRRIWHAA